MTPKLIVISGSSGAGKSSVLRLLEDVPDDQFRKLILDAKVLNTLDE